MKIFINGVEYDATKEIEIFNYDKGFDVTLKYKDNLSGFHPIIKRRAGKIVEFWNITEFHHLRDNDTTVFESRIHFGGIEYEMNDVIFDVGRAFESITIKDSVCIADSM